MSNYCVVGGCLLSLSLCKNDFQDLLKVRPSSFLMLCGCISSSIAETIEIRKVVSTANINSIRYKNIKS